MTTTRALMPDYLRLFALFGIVVVNVQYIAFSALEPVSMMVDNDGSAAVASWLVNGLAASKSYSLFSFMFGVGLGFQMMAAERRGLPFGKVYRRRMFGLALLGVLHAMLFFIGDVLVVYAITGSILYLMRNWPVKRLVRFGVALIVVQVLIIAPASLLPEEPIEWVALEREVMTAGTFLDAVAFRSVGSAIMLPVFLIFQGIATLGWFCLGLAAVRSGVIDNPDHSLWLSARRYWLVPGVLGSLAAAAWAEWGDPGVGFALLSVFAPVASFGYLGVIAAVSRPPGPVMQRVLVAGGSSLTIYLGQSILMSTIFSAYGFGLWEAVGRDVATGIAIAVTLVLIAGVLLWRRAFALGPFEMVLRGITYGGIRGRT